MSKPAIDPAIDKVEANPETIGDRVGQNIAQAKAILQEQGDLDKSSDLLVENKVLLGIAGFDAEITPEMLEKVDEKVAQTPKMDEQAQQVEIGRYQFLLLMQDVTGLDFSDGDARFSVFDIFDAIMGMAKPGAMSEVMDKMKRAVNDLNVENPDATAEEKFEAAKGAAENAVDEMAQEQKQEQEVKGSLTGINGTAVTYAVTKEPDLVVENLKINPIIQEGGSLITGTFTAHVRADGAMVDAKLDQDAANSPSFALPAEPEVAAVNTHNGYN